MKNMNKKGFTLVELLIVITIIGILAAALLPSILGAPAKSRDAAREAGINSVVTAIESYVAEGNTYPTKAGEGAFECLNDFDGSDATLPDLTSYFQGGQIPQDPAGNKIGVGECTSYIYKRLDGSPANYALLIQMEDSDKNNVVGGSLAAVKLTSAYNDLVDACVDDADNPCDAYTKSF